LLAGAETDTKASLELEDDDELDDDELPGFGSEKCYQCE
jgi:hypothetical protein